MKLFGHPIHLMLIHFPAALFPMELVAYFLFYKTGSPSFGSASYFAIVGGVLFGWLAIFTGATDFIKMEGNGEVQAKALVHGTVNTIVVIGYSLIAYILYKTYPDLPPPAPKLFAIKVSLNVLMIVGNFLGGNLVLKYNIGVTALKKERL